MESRTIGRDDGGQMWEVFLTDGSQLLIRADTVKFDEAPGVAMFFVAFPDSKYELTVIINISVIVTAAPVHKEGE